MNLVIDFILGNQYVVGAIGALIGIGLFLFKRKSKDVVVVNDGKDADAFIESTKENAEALENKAKESKDKADDHIQKSEELLNDIKEVNESKPESVKSDSNIEELDNAFKDKNL
jgi:hypothetical protein